jgi:predicted small metal-binding protein
MSVRAVRAKEGGMSHTADDLWGAPLGEVIPGCDFEAIGNTKDEVLERAREHLSQEHNREMDDVLATAIRELTRPIGK